MGINLIGAMLKGVLVEQKAVKQSQKTLQFCTKMEARIQGGSVHGQEVQEESVMTMGAMAGYMKNMYMLYLTKQT